MCCSIKEWKKTLRKKKKQHTVERLEEASEEVWSILVLRVSKHA